MWPASVFSQGRFHWFIDHAANNKDEGSPRQGRRLTYNAIESGGNEFLVWCVASVGFFTDSYLLFASNMIVPMLSFVYWPEVAGPSRQEVINIATLAGCIVGMILFGILGDIYGRRKMYGIELIILIVGTVGVVMSSNGFTTNNGVTGLDTFTTTGTNGSMSIESWLIFWRFVSGIGIGGDYPLSAVIVSEFAPKSKRARMLAAVLCMQALGILAASVVSLVVVSVVRAQHINEQNSDLFRRAVDHIWRWVMALGLIPAALAVIVRLSIPESPRYTLDVLDDPSKAFEEANRFNDSQLQDDFNLQTNMDLVDAFARSKMLENGGDGILHANSEKDVTNRTQATTRTCEEPIKYTVKDYFWKQGNWRYLLGTSLTWFFLDFAFFGLGLSSPKAISKIWYNGVQYNNQDLNKIKTWDVTYTTWTNPDTVVFEILMASAWHSLIVVSVGAMVGSISLVIAIKHFNRKRLQWIMFIVLGLLFLITGGTYRIGNSGVTITLYILCQICFYFGPNGLIFVIPAELFATRYRTTCYGLSAATGKLGSIVVQIFLAYSKFGPEGAKTTWLSPDSVWFGDVLLIFAAPMFLGAIVSWWFIPDLQGKDGRSLSLEHLADCRGRRPVLDDADEV